MNLTRWQVRYFPMEHNCPCTYSSADWTDEIQNPGLKSKASENILAASYKTVPCPCRRAYTRMLHQNNKSSCLKCNRWLLVDHEQKQAPDDTTSYHTIPDHLYLQKKKKAILDTLFSEIIHWSIYLNKSVNTSTQNLIVEICNNGILSIMHVMQFHRWNTNLCNTVKI